MHLKGNLILLLVAVIWGFAFAAQRSGMEYIGPFTYTGVRFFLGCLSLLPLLFYLRGHEQVKVPGVKKVSVLKAGIITGAIMCIAVSFQQIGLVYTTAGKAAFVTCLYIVLVPMVGIFLKQKIASNTWLGAALALYGLYLLCVKDGFSMEYGDALMLVSAFFWTIHILVIDRYANAVDSIRLAFCQFFVCAVLSMLVAVMTEEIAIASLIACAVPIAYGGIMSVGVAYTLQIVGQKYAQPAHAAVIMSMETVFGAISGYLFLNEYLGLRELMGCLVMMAGMLLTQAGAIWAWKKNPKPAAELCSRKSV